MINKELNDIRIVIEILDKEANIVRHSILAIVMLWNYKLY